MLFYLVATTKSYTSFIILCILHELVADEEDQHQQTGIDKAACIYKN